MPRRDVRPPRRPARARLLPALLVAVVGLVVSACGPPPVEVDANDPQTAMRLADTWIAALPSYAETTADDDPFVPAVTQAGGDVETVRVLRRAGTVDGITTMQAGLEAWVAQALRAAAPARDLVGVRTVGLAAGRAQGHLQRAADQLGKGDVALTEARLSTLATSAGVTAPREVAALTAAYAWALEPYRTADGAAHTAAELRRALRAGPPPTG